MKNEQCWILSGKVQGNLWWAKPLIEGSGCPVSVEFNYDRSMKQEEKGKLVGWAHTHPSFLAVPSNRDHATMKVWVLSLGHSLVCVIKGIDGTRSWWYLDDESPPIECQIKVLRNFLFGIKPDRTEK